MPSQRRQSHIYRFWGVLFLSSLVLSLWLGYPPLMGWQIRLLDIATAQSPTPSELVQQGISRYQAGDFQSAILSWQTALKAYQDRHHTTSDQVTVLKYLVRAYQQVGRIDQAITDLERVITYYRQVRDHKQLLMMLTEQAQSYSSLGQHRRAIAILCGDKYPTCSKDSVLEIARSQSDYLGEVAALGSLGNAYRLQGEYEYAIDCLSKSLEIAQKIDNIIYISAALNGLANTYASRATRNYYRAKFTSLEVDQTSAQKFKQEAVGDDNKALQYFEKNLSIARGQSDQQSEMRSLLGLISLYHHNLTDNSSGLVNNTLQQALVILKKLPDSRSKAYATIKLADLLQIVKLDIANSVLEPATQCPDSESSPKSIELLNKAVLIAQNIKDQETESFAQGRLGHIYECRHDYQQALTFTQKARLATVAKENLYLWEWQAGRIFKAQGRVDDAINVYEKSVNTLRSVRSDIAITGRDLQFDFRDTVEPVYRELLEVRLESASNSTRESDIQENLTLALKNIDELRITELQNYLGNYCNLQPLERPVAKVRKNNAVFTSVILKDRIAVILNIPDSKRTLNTKIHFVPVKTQEAIKIINELRFQLEKRTDRENTFKTRSQQVYDWFIRPFMSDLDREQIETLVFIQDGILRSIPMAVLYDGNQFLAEKYAIANTPSLTLTQPTTLSNKKLRVLAFGLTKPAAVDAQTSFEALKEVKSEINSIERVIPGSKGLLDQDFTRKSVKQELEKNAYPIIHFATHGKFGADSSETFLVTGNNEKLTMNELYQIIKNTYHRELPIQLLTLSACETGIGSERDALGIAGISLEAGSQSAVASLWQVDDKATAQIITKFYQGLREGLSKAQALQAAQKAWLQEHPNGLYRHPGYWAAFILVGNWL
ncbi:MAG: CHAT domain-containing protein [Stigonema ocellatum SAG 48.90 = DSM 106950]|nr:CHAT domain-containing protein [Stigonema ocellatum SAG 48.90 = DSM 106950]